MNLKTRVPMPIIDGRIAVRRPGARSVALLLLLGMSSAVWADAASDLAKLDGQCEAAREAKIKPLRDAEIAKCKADARNDPDYCERYWRDYGNASRRANGTMTPRMFDDLPECVAAAKARAAQNQDGR